MINSFRDRETAALFAGKDVREWRSIKRIAERKLTFVDSATALGDLASPPGNRLEKLEGDRKSQHSIRINDQWRICFVWHQNGPHDVEITDYH
jgi:proteic killer suppression protein